MQRLASATSPILLAIFCSALSSFPVPGALAQEVIAPVVGKTMEYSATGDAGNWDFSGADITVKAGLQEVWVLDPYSDVVPFINAFNLQNLSAAPRQITVQLPLELRGATVLGLAEIPRGDLAGKNLVLVDPAFRFPNTPSPLFGVIEDDGRPLAGGSFRPPSGLDPGSRLAAIDINPERDEIAVYDLSTRSFYLLDFNFTAIGGPFPLVGFLSFFASPWGLGSQLEGNGGGIAFSGPDTVLAPAGLLNIFEAHLLIEYDLRRAGAPSGRAVDLSAAGGPHGSDLAFAGIDTGRVAGETVVLALNSGDDSVYAFRFLPGFGPPPIATLECALLDSGRYEARWSLDNPGEVDAVHLYENGVEAAVLDPRALLYRSPFPLLGSGRIELATEKAGVVGPVRSLCQIEDSRTPRLPGIEGDSTVVGTLGTLAGVAVTKTPASREDFRGYLLGLASNSLAVFDHRLDILETLKLSPPVQTQGQNLAAMGVALVRLDGQDHLALLDPDGPNGFGAATASIYYLDGARRGKLRQRLDAIDFSRLRSTPSLVGWDSDRDGNFVAGGLLPATGEYALVRILFDGKKMWATQTAPIPQRALTPFVDRPLVGIAVTVLPSGNLLVAGADTFSRTYTEALLLTPFSDSPLAPPRFVGYAQGLPIPEHIRDSIGIEAGPTRLFGFAAAHFPPEPGLPAGAGAGAGDGIGVSYLPLSTIAVIKNRAGFQLYFPADLLLHAENRCSHPDLKAEAIDDETLELDPGASAESGRSSPSFTAAAEIDYFAYVLNASASESARLSVEVALGGSALPEAGGPLVLQPGRYFRRFLPERPEKDLRLRLKNLGDRSIRVRIALGAMAVLSVPSERRFRRGDCDGNGRVTLSDAIFGLARDFLGGPAPACPDACDADDDGLVEVSDMVLILNYLFLAGAKPSPPGPRSCGMDPTPDDPLEPCARGVCQ